MTNFPEGPGWFLEYTQRLHIKSLTAIDAHQRLMLSIPSEQIDFKLNHLPLKFYLIQHYSGVTLLNKLSVSSFFSLMLTGVLISAARAQVVPEDSVITFETVSTDQLHSMSASITNTYPYPVSISTAGFREPEFSTDFTPRRISPAERYEFKIHFNSEQNIDYTDFLAVTADSTDKPIIFKVQASGAFPETYYTATQNKWAEDLKASLRDIIDGHTSLGYTLARDHMYGSIDNVNGWVECVYTGRKAQFSDRAGATSNKFNCEHTWPQSFFNENEPMRSDLFHLYPTDETANSQRGNYDFGTVKSVIWTEGDSRLGTDQDGLTVFEPRPVHRGNVARSHFYFAIRYNKQYIEYQNAAKMESVLRQWHSEDSVDTAERNRNNMIFALQKNRNPFIDHPALAERISSFFSVSEKINRPVFSASPASVHFYNVPPNKQALGYLAVINSGEAPLYISSIQCDQPQFSINKSILDIPAESYAYIQITFLSGDSAGVVTGNLLIQSNDPENPQLIIPISAETKPETSLGNPDFVSAGFRLYQNFPNPFNNATSVRFNLPAASVISLFITDNIGRVVRNLISNELQPAGDHQIQFSAEDLAAGVYYCTLKAGTVWETKRLVLLK